MSALRGAVHAKWIIGKVIGTKMQKTAKVRVTRLVLDPYLLKFYNKRKTYFAHDPEQRCTEGDIVLLKALPERRSRHVKHALAEIVFKVGRVVDPVTGQPCAGTRRAEEGLQDGPENLTQRDASCLSQKLRDLALGPPTDK
ncbi:small ribosomal subunit protein uS17m isoform X2 [Anolis sagrei]|nr:small ribosomal subunit protein uS17m [Anolis sagrei ordinatus]